MRQRLAKIGFMASDLKELDSDKAQKFLLISAEFDKIQNEQQQKAAAKGKK